MAAAAQAQAVKCLDTSSGRKRFVFKSFSQRVSEIEIDVFRSFGPVKSEPSEGSSFFRDCLLEWRELNTAEEFISFYEEMMPLVQTLPQILLHKELIFSELLRRVNMAAKLSLEPILRLTVSLSRDILEEFLPLLGPLVDSFYKLFDEGGDRDPEVLEQVFTSFSCILMHLQKYLVKDVINILRITTCLRYYTKNYIQEFMAEAISFLLRSAPKGHLIQGIKMVLQEAVEDLCQERKIGISSLLWHVMRGTSSRLHSKAEQVLRLLMSRSILCMQDEVVEGKDIVIEVVTETLRRLCEALEPAELMLAWNCLLEEINSTSVDSHLLHLDRLLSILTSAIQFRKGTKFCDILPVIDLVKLLTQKYVMPSSNLDPEDFPEIVNKVLMLILCLLDVSDIVNGLSSLSPVVLELSPVFHIQNHRLLGFIKEMLLKGYSVLNAFKTHIVSALDDLVLLSPEEVLYLLLMFYEREGNLCFPNGIIGESDVRMSNMQTFFEERLRHWVSVITTIVEGSQGRRMEIHVSDLAIFWGILKIYPNICRSCIRPSSISILVDALSQLLSVETDSIAGLSKSKWQSVAGTLLATYHKTFDGYKAGHSEISKFLNIAQQNKSSSQILSAVADFLDFLFGSPDGVARNELVEFDVEHAVAALEIFEDNLAMSAKPLRISTLRILSHYPSLDQQSASEEHPSKKLKADGSRPAAIDPQDVNVISLLLSIETTPPTVSSSRKMVILISKIQMNIVGGNISDAYIPLLCNGLIGILYNRFGHLWQPAIECLIVLITRHKDLVWNQFVEYFGIIQLEFLSSAPQDTSAVDHVKSNGLCDCFNSFLTVYSESTPSSTILCLLLQTLQKIPEVVESESRQIVPLFLNFFGYADNDASSRCLGCKEKSCSCRQFNKKEWKLVLKEWLNLLRLLRNSRSISHSQILKDILTYRLLDDTDSNIQLKVLDCLLNWKDDFLLPYGQHLKNLVSAKNLREELATWSLAKDSSNIQEVHRGFLIPLVIRVLVPKIRKLKTLASRKSASINHRRAILRSLSLLDVEELSLFFSLLIKNLFSNSGGINSYDELDGPLEKLLSFSLLFLQKEPAFIQNISWKKKFGFLHVVGDILRNFDEFHVKPFLNVLLAVVVKILEECTGCMLSAKVVSCKVDDYAVGLKRKRPTAKDMKKSIEASKDLRSLCLKIFCFTLNKYDCTVLHSQIWDIFFTSVQPLIDSFEQDVSGSEHPSSLLLCFVAMSKNPSYISLLEGLVSTIFSVLTKRTASNVVISSVLSFIENLLVLDSDVEYHDSVNRVLVPHLNGLFSGLRQLFQHHRESQRKATMFPGMKEIRILKLLGRYVNDTSIATEFLDIILLFFKKKDLDLDECLEGLHVIKGMLSLIDEEATRRVVNMASILLSFAGVGMRQLVCDIIEGLSVTHPSLEFLAKLLRNLNAVSSTELDELDYDTRICAYELITVDLFYTLQEECAEVILSQCVYDLSSDLVLRQTASRALISFINFATSILCNEMNSHDNLPSDDLMLNEELYKGKVTVDAGAFSRKQIQRFIRKFLLQNMGEAMNKVISVNNLLSREVDVSIHKEWIILLKEMVRKLPGIPALCSLRPLHSELEETDFFSNILHLQTHRRVKALSRFKTVVSVDSLSQDISEKVFIPLFFSMMFEVKAGKGEHLINACIETIASVSGVFSWRAYSGLLMRILRYIQKMHSKPDKQKILMRLLISVLDKLHLSGLSSNHMPEDEGPDVQSDYLKPAVPECDMVQHKLQKVFFPQIQKLLDADSDGINAKMSLAALKVLKLLPKDIMESQLPSIIQRISNFLKSRLESMRDEARTVLAACLRELGLSYLGYVIKILQETLKRGYEMHVLAYSLNFLLSKLLSHMAIGSLDSCLEKLLSIVENDILGDVAEQKEVVKIASKMKETRKTKSFETLKLVSQNITFRTHALKLLSPIQQHLKDRLTVKKKAKLELMLSCIASGIESNPSVDQRELFIFVYGLVEDVSEASYRDKVLVTAHKKLNHCILSRDGTDDTLHGNRPQPPHSSHLISVFALGLLHNRLRNMKLDKKDEHLLSMLDPFVKLLGICMSSKYEDVLSAAFKCLIPLVRLPLPSLELYADKIKISLLDIAQKSGNVTSPLMHSCLKLLTVLLQSTSISLSDDQLQMLTQFPLFIDLQSRPSHIALSLLKAIVSRKLVVHEIYDLVTQVAELMVTCQIDAIRKKCSQILLQFLLDYRLSNKRLEQHLDFLLRNLSYEHSSGREAVLEMFHAILVKFPLSVVENHVQSWFLSLVVALVKDTDKSVQSMVATIIKMLLGRISQQALHPVLEYCLSWYKGENQQLWSAAAQVLGLIIDVMKKNFRRHVSSVLPVAKRIMKSAIALTADKEADLTSDGVPWREAYHSLVMLEKMLSQLPELCFDRSNEDLWDVISKFLLHPHAWLRSISNQIFALYFAAASNSGMVTGETSNMELSLLSHSRLFLLSVLFCNQLRSHLMDDATSNLIIQNLAFTICGVHSFAKQKVMVPVNKLWSTFSSHEQGLYLEGFDLLGSRKGREAFVLHTLSGMHPESENVNPDLQSLLVIPLLSKIGKLALTKGDIQMKIVFNCYRAISSQIGAESCRYYAIQMLLPLYRVCEGFAGKVIADEIKELAAGIRDHISRLIGVDHFVKAYNLIRKGIKEKREKRKRGEKLIAVIDPMRHAKRKLRIAEKHRIHKKKKMALMKMGRWRR